MTGPASSHSNAAATGETPVAVSFAVAVLYWLRLGFISFGGPAGQIAIMQTELVERRRWIAQQPFMAGLNFAMLLPGPEAQQLATYIGWRLHGLKGALAAGILFVAPGAMVLLALAWLAAAYGDAAWLAALFDGFRPVVVAIIAAALAIGALSGRYRPGLFATCHPATDGAPLAAATARPAWRRLAVLAIVFTVLWALPVTAIVLALGPDPWRGITALFTKAAFVTFGGAYAVLPYVAAEAVEHYHWLSSAQMIDGLALAETTPGPLILVTQWIGWFAGFNNAGTLPAATAGLLGAVLTTYVTFLPCFLFILAGAPYVDRVSRNAYAAGALGAVTAAVVGVIASLGVYIGRAALLPGDAPDPVAIAMAIVALLVLLTTRVGIPWLVLAGGLAGLATRAAGVAA